MKLLLFSFFVINISENIIKISVIPEQKFVKHAQMMLITFCAKMKHQIKGVSELYKGIINIKGLGYSVHVTKKNDKFNLFFRFGFKDTYNYIMPDFINIENWETAKIHLILSTYSLELLNQVKRNIQRLRMPKVYKLQGIYLDNKFPKLKKYVK